MNLGPSTSLSGFSSSCCFGFGIGLSLTSSFSSFSLGWRFPVGHCFSSGCSATNLSFLGPRFQGTGVSCSVSDGVCSVGFSCIYVIGIIYFFQFSKKYRECCESFNIYTKCHYLYHYSPLRFVVLLSKHGPLHSPRFLCF